MFNSNSPYEKIKQALRNQDFEAIQHLFPKIDDFKERYSFLESIFQVSNPASIPLQQNIVLWVWEQSDRNYCANQYNATIFQHAVTKGFHELVELMLPFLEPENFKEAYEQLQDQQKNLLNKPYADPNKQRKIQTHLSHGVSLMENHQLKQQTFSNPSRRASHRL